jgi:cell division protein ZapA
MDKKSVQVEIFGVDYTLKSDTSEEYIKGIAQLVDQKMRKLSDSTSVKTPVKIAVLTALNLADELSQLKEKYQNEIEHFEVKSKELSERIEHYLEQNKKIAS